MSDQSNLPGLARPAFWRRGLAGLFDFLTVFFVGGYLVGSLTGRRRKTGLICAAWRRSRCLAPIVPYFYLGWKVLGGTV